MIGSGILENGNPEPDSWKPLHTLHATIENTVQYICFLSL